jgi:aldose 1-epimerase
VTVAGGDLRVELRLRNLSDARMPAGVGLHPWFVGRPEVAINAELVFESNTDSPPQPRLVSGVLDRRAKEVMPPDLDATWARVGRRPVTMRWPELGIEADMSVDAPSVYVCAASPTDIAAVAVEPQTHGPDGLRRLINHEPAALAVLDPGDALAMAMTLSFRRTQEDRQ